MSGLFRRLAERASGQRQPMLHAWVLPVFLAGDGLIEDDPPPLPAPLTLTPLPPQTPLTPVVPQPAPEPSFDRREQPATPLVLPDPEPRQAAAGIAAPVPIAPPLLPIAQTHSQEAPPRTEPEPAIASVLAPIPHPANAQALAHPPAQLLMPASVRTHPAGPVPVVFNPPPSPPAADEIHVHIGRIEVTAVREPAPAKHSARTPKPTLSLDDYLAKRRGQQSRGEPS
ncbi:MAG: hypothetical protein JWQ69_798 [Pseudomonas sp.]|nr:hypothetical protein [Pseudomonas sp.]